ncbi:MAG: T9SS type A sorting domain-containing protein [Bacteroidota bacterium]
MTIKKFVYTGLLIGLLILPSTIYAQSMREVKPLVKNEPVTIIDYGDEINYNTHIPFNGELNSVENAARLNELNNAVFEVTYEGFTSASRAAFQYAVDIWSTLLTSDVPIRIHARMENLGAGVLGQTSVTSYYANFDNAQKMNSYYAVCLAEKIAGKHLNDTSDYDIAMQFNTDFPWYFGLDGNTPSNNFDFVSVILHEIAHGLGFIDGTNVYDGLGYYYPMAYDRYIETLPGDNLVDNYASGTTDLMDQLTGGELYFHSFSFPAISERPKLYAPHPWDPGSSIAHLDENTYPAGNANSLMSPRFGYSESIHHPGLSLKMFQDMGWYAMNFNFQKFMDSEDSIADRTLTAVITGDYNALPDKINLHYTYSDFSSEVVETMVATGNPNEYEAIIPATGSEELVKYYIDLDTDAGKIFTSPGEAPQYFWEFTMARDTINPEIEHDSIALVYLDDNSIPIDVLVSDNIGIGNLTMTYRINGGATKSVIIPLKEAEEDGWYTAEHYLDWDISSLGLSRGDLIEYRFETQDIASVVNTASLPEEGYYQVETEKLNDAVSLYENDFNSSTDDFVGTGFSISLVSGFDNNAIHSDHPYKIEDGQYSDDTLVNSYMLKTPIILSDKDASLVFDEVALIEPGGNGTEYGDADFWDYVIVEGAKHHAGPWLPLKNGYDSREHQVWLDQWESGQDSNGNSSAEGNSSLFVNTEINMISNGNFVAGDTILVRFKLYADQLAHGWGWTIDNLKIQKDEKPPVVTQITPDYLMVGDTELTLKSKVIDNVELDSVVYEVDYNGQTQIISFPGTANLFTLDLGFTPAITETDLLKYRIIAVDKAPDPNTIIYPLTGFFEIPVAQFGEAKSMYVNDFNSASDDFIGQNFMITQPDKFNNPALVTTNPYPLSPFESSEFSYLFKYPIILGQSRAMVTYDEIVLIEPDVDKVSFEASKDNGQTWIPVFDPYDATAYKPWKNIFIANYDENGTSQGVAEPFLVQNRIFDILDNPEFSAGEEVLVRFKVSVDDKINGWGWYIDNLEIQSPSTAIEEATLIEFEVYPNPSQTGIVAVKGRVSGQNSKILVTNLLGKLIYEEELTTIGNEIHTILHLNHLKKGVYLVSLLTESGVSTKRIIFE